MGMPVNAPSEQLAGLNISPFFDASTTRQTVLYPSGALSLAAQYRLLPGATAVANQLMRLVINAASDADADGRLATPGAYIALCQGDDIVLGASSGDPIMRVDFKAAQAVGAEKTLLQLIAGVRT